MRRAKARLFISELRREVDWDDDRIYLQTLNIVSEHAARAIVRNSHNAIHSRFVLTGKGWPGSMRFGFMRDRRGWIVADPEAWPFVEAICYGYARLQGYPTMPMIRGAANRAGMASMAAMWRVALGDERALRRVETTRRDAGDRPLTSLGARRRPGPACRLVGSAHAARATAALRDALPEPRAQGARAWHDAASAVGRGEQRRRVMVALLMVGRPSVRCAKGDRCDRPRLSTRFVR